MYFSVIATMCSHIFSSSGSSASVFTFEHQEAYRKIQFLFYDAVESLDHNNIMVRFWASNKISCYQFWGGWLSSQQ